MGIPQYSILGHLLFITFIYTKYIYYSDRNLYHILFTDYTIEYLLNSKISKMY